MAASLALSKRAFEDMYLRMEDQARNRRVTGVIGNEQSVGSGYPRSDSSLLAGGWRHDRQRTHAQPGLGRAWGGAGGGRLLRRPRCAGAAGSGGHRPGTRRLGSSRAGRSEEHTSELQSLIRISYAVFCLKKKKTTHTA